MPTAKVCGHAISYRFRPTRGVCKTCHNKLSSLVTRKLATWAALEAEGKCSPLVEVVHPWRREMGKPHA